MSSQETKDKQSKQYDEWAKKILGNKNVLSRILIGTIDEYKGHSPENVISLIEGEPFIGVVPIDPGHTNKKYYKDGMQIVGLNGENSSINEGLIRFDVLFYVRTPDGVNEILVNVEAQKDSNLKYPILNRSIFYACREIASQKERDFRHSEYGKIKKSYSIWVCMNMKQNSLNHIHLVNDAIKGDQVWKGDLGLFNIIMIGITNDLPDENDEMHRLLCALFSRKLEENEKNEVIEEEYGIHDPALLEGVSEMCNLSEDVKEEGRVEGEKQKEIEIVLNMVNEGASDEMIIKFTKISEEKLNKIKQKYCK